MAEGDLYEIALDNTFAGSRSRAGTACGQAIGFARGGGTGLDRGGDGCAALRWNSPA